MEAIKILVTSRTTELCFTFGGIIIHCILEQKMKNNTTERVKVLIVKNKFFIKNNEIVKYVVSILGRYLL